MQGCVLTEDARTKLSRMLYDPNFSFSDRDEYLVKTMPLWLGHIEQLAPPLVNQVRTDTCRTVTSNLGDRYSSRFKDRPTRRQGTMTCNAHNSVNPFYTIYAAVRLGPIIPYTHRCVFTCVSTRATINFLVLPF